MSGGRYGSTMCPIGGRFPANLRGLERAAGILPRSTWAYFTVRAVAP